MVLLTLHEYSQLWEITSSLGGSSDAAEQSRADVRATATAILYDFAKRGWLRVSRQAIRDKDPVGDPEPVDLTELERILSDETSWTRPDSHDGPTDHFLVFDTTPAAEEQIRKGAIDDIWPGRAPSNGQGR